MKSSSTSRFALALGLVVSGPARAGLAEGQRCLDAYDLRCAIRERDALLSAGATDPVAQDFIAQTYFHEGRYEDALAIQGELAKEGYAFDPHAPPFEAAAMAARDFVATEEGELAVRRAPGIDVILVDEAFDVMAKAIDTYADLLGGRPDFPVRLDIYPDGTRFIAASGLPAEAVRTTGVIALSKWNRLLVTSPRALPRGYAWKDTIAHEYIHLVVAYRTNDHTPVWLQEGLAKYFEGAWRGEDGGPLSVQQQTLLAAAVKNDSFVPFEKFKHSMAYLESPADAALAFAQVSTMVRYLVETRGKTSLPSVLDRVRDGEDAETAFAAAAGEPDFDALLVSWKSWLRTMPLVAEQIASLPVVLDDPADDFEGDPALDAREDLRKFARLGDLLREKERYAAALVEYDKAMDPEGPSSPTLFARRATCYAALGDPQKALGVVEEGVRLYPEFALLQVSRARILDTLGRVPDATTAWLAAHDSESVRSRGPGRTREGPHRHRSDRARGATQALREPPPERGDRRRRRSAIESVTKERPRMTRDTEGTGMDRTTSALSAEPRDDGQLFETLSQVRVRLAAAIHGRIVGQEQVIEDLLIALFARGHCLFIGVPGLAKTLLVSTTAEALGLSFGRVQFTPDLMPADITGTEVLEEDRSTGRRSMRFIHGPIFTNLLLADEINRTPPKTQAALLQAMQESQVTAAGKTWKLDPPFLVFATQNPIEQEGTYPLPEAELDRFMFSVNVGYPSEDDEVQIVERTTTGEQATVEPVLDRDLSIELQGLVRRLPTSRDVNRYAVRLARASRPEAGASDFVKRWVQWGAGPRASQYLSLGARVRAALHGNEVPSLEDVRAVAPAVLGHRVLVNFQAEAERIDARAVVGHLLETVEP